MLMVNQLAGFGGIAASGVYAEGSAISGATGTNIGNLTAFGGLAAAFDGNTNQTGGNGAGSAAADPGYVGKDYSAAPKRIFKVVTHGSNNAGYIATGTPSVTVTLYGKNGGAPASGTDGTSLGSINFTDLADESAGRTINNGGDLSTLWDYVWVAVSIGSNTDPRVAEVIFTEAVPA